MIAFPRVLISLQNSRIVDLGPPDAFPRPRFVVEVCQEKNALGEQSWTRLTRVTGEMSALLDALADKVYLGHELAELANMAGDKDDYRKGLTNLSAAYLRA